MRSDKTGWEGILEIGEDILWQGRPQVRFRIKPFQIAAVIFGMAFSGFALFWMIMASQSGGFFWMFGLLHFFVGLSIGIGPVLINNLRLRGTWYTLTDRRAFIASEMPVMGRRIKSYQINAGTVLELKQSNPPSVYFAHEIKQGQQKSYQVGIGFEGIQDGVQVMAMMRDIQKARKS